MNWIKNALGLAHPDEIQLDKIRKEIDSLLTQKVALSADLINIRNEMETKTQSLVVVNEELLLQSFGLYEPHYNFQSSMHYKSRLDEIRQKQKVLITGSGIICGETNWAVNGSKKEGKKMVSDITKLLIRAFNAECDSLVEKVRFNNLDTAKQRMTKTFEAINKSGRVLGISIAPEYLILKIDELHLSYEYEVKKQQEKDELAKKREQLREQQKVIREIEAMKQKIAKEETHFQQAITAAKERIEKTSDAEVRAKLEEKIAELEQKLIALEKDKQDVFNREQNTRAGYVYVISNEGAFGKDVYKIGVTRRLDPTDRVRELGDASVPFSFDVHALIFSQDAPRLEYELHKAFENNRLNKINPRKEFFHVPLREIEDLVRRFHDKEVEFTSLAYADEYRQSQKMVSAVPAQENNYDCEELASD